MKHHLVISDIHVGVWIGCQRRGECIDKVSFKLAQMLEASTELAMQ
jgi:metallophosphoesterase superfamily enzyme